jgi:hypothetical protein
MKFTEFGRAYLSATLLIFLAVPCLAFTDGSNTDTLNNKPNVKFAFRIPKFDFSIVDAAQEGVPIDYAANTLLSLGVSLHYKSFGILALKELGSSTDTLLGTTKYTDVQIYYYLNKIGFELFYQKYKGYYLSSSDKFGYAEGDSNTIRPDINTQNIGFNMIYLFSNKYSLNALLTQDERLNERNWSFFIMGSFNQIKINSSKNLIPVSEMSHYGTSADYRGGYYNVVSVSPGVSFTYPHNKYYLSIAGFGGFGLSYSENQFSNRKRSLIEPFIKANVKLSYGYYGIHWSAGMSGSIDGVTPMKEGKEIQFQTFSGYVELFFGYRF